MLGTAIRESASPLFYGWAVMCPSGGSTSAQCDTKNDTRCQCSVVCTRYDTDAGISEQSTSPRYSGRWSNPRSNEYEHEYSVLGTIVEFSHQPARARVLHTRRAQSIQHPCEVAHKGEVSTRHSFPYPSRLDPSSTQAGAQDVRALTGPTEKFPTRQLEYRVSRAKLCRAPTRDLSVQASLLISSS